LIIVLAAVSVIYLYNNPAAENFHVTSPEAFGHAGKTVYSDGTRTGWTRKLQNFTTSKNRLSASQKSVSKDSARRKQEPLVILTSPFRIVQAGVPRTGSTFQFRLMEAIARLKSPKGARVQSNPRSARECKGQVSCIAKVHDLSATQRWRRLGFAVFSSGNLTRDAIYNQDRERLINCSLCEVERYQAIFRLSGEEVQRIKDHMSLFEIIRMCCGLQMSQRRRMSLHSCNINTTKRYKLSSDDQLSSFDPHCEQYNIPEVERQYYQSPLRGPEGRPDLLWSKPGDCKKFDGMIRAGADFNKRKFVGCPKGK
jgi:hypothetical protein